jgi:gliding motility-associated-like protein
LAYQSHAQNLVPNCSFEDYLTCPNSSGQMFSCRNWYSPGEGTPDYCNQCNTGSYSVPSNLWGSQEAKDGYAYTNIISYYASQPQYREYLQAKLVAPLNENEAYRVSFFLSCSDESMFAIDRLGLHFSNAPLEQPGKSVIILPSGPHLYNPEGNILDKKDIWIELNGVYIASGGEQYITIGNFFSDNSTEINVLGNQGLNIASYFIDEIKVEPMESWLDLGPDTTLCPGESYTLSAQMPGEAGYTWNNGSKEPQITVTSAGNYSVSVNFGCDVIEDHVKINYDEDPYPFLSIDTAICPGQQIIIDAGNQFSAYLWNDGSQEQSIVAQEGGTYWVEVVNQLGCTFRDSVIILPINVPNCYLGMDTILCLGQAFELHTGFNGPYTEYEWNDASTEETLVVSDSGFYWVRVSNPCGTKGDTIHIGYINCEPTIFVPNAFTPNGDLKNDVFLPKGVNIGNYRMIIYDRWGNEVFESNILESGWDGRYNGELCPNGIYVWVISYENIENELKPKAETIKGSCLLLQ